jgi:serine-type D-Ala-D-Ala endopeptidase (penicillin-binding protein 7)
MQDFACHLSRIPMKKIRFTSLRCLKQHLDKVTRPVLAGLLVTGLAVPMSLFAVPDAVAATAVAHSADTNAKKKRVAKPGAQFVHTRVARKRVTFAMASGARRGHVSRVAFAPAHTQAFRMRESDGGGVGQLILRSSAALVIDQNTHEALYDKNSHTVMPIASISKLMTAMVALDSKAPLNEMLQVTDADRDYEKNTGSRLSVGSELSREDMLHIALMSSENRAAAALSRYFPGGRPAFVAAMNKKALELGMTDTHFLDPTGLSPNVSSARDLVKMVNAAYQYPMIRDFSTDTAYDVNTGKRTLHYASTNALVRNPGWKIGLQKTGFTNEAGECMVMQTTVHDRPVIMVLLDSTGKYSRVADAQRVHTWLDLGGVQRVTSVDTVRAGT